MRPRFSAGFLWLFCAVLPGCASWDAFWSAPERPPTGAGAPGLRVQNGVVTDGTRIWQPCSYGQEAAGRECIGRARPINWFQARDYCRRLNLAGKAWRLPSRSDLESLLRPELPAPPYIDASVFPAAANGPYWSRSPFQDSDRSRWTVHFSAARSLGETLAHGAHVRCIADPRPANVRAAEEDEDGGDDDDSSDEDSPEAIQNEPPASILPLDQIKDHDQD